MARSLRRVRPFDALRGELTDESGWGDPAPGYDGSLRLDPDRRARTGVPEVVLADGKSAATVRAALEALAGRTGRAVASRCQAGQVAEIERDASADFRLVRHDEARAVVLVRLGHPNQEIRPTGGRVGVITAGASDAVPAAEAALIAREMGCVVAEVRDVGVAGLHRLARPLEAVVGEGVDAIVVAAGMDGALPSVVAGLVDVPVIGLPTSVGYGFGGRGEAALLAMLQSCATGLVVVNIDNGIGAGAAAARIANRAARARGGPGI
jgi:NCAIR mutase (PurE)-related protein